VEEEGERGQGETEREERGAEKEVTAGLGEKCDWILAMDQVCSKSALAKRLHVMYILACGLAFEGVYRSSK
jgi:hypothetical protein